ncbi:DUF1707 domain-containing protein [Nocardia tengchongensis]|uniref:DUF1707 SHOCT-like domain-containing protein n=1 Tax=Nocardia tengchongensis TaxID=2055889 RepID=UPI00368F328F
MNESPHIRVSAADRERAMTELAHHFSTGTLSLAEFDARSIQVLHADHRDQLADLFTDLPAAPAQAPPDSYPPRWPRPLLQSILAVALGLGFWYSLGTDLWLPLVGCVLVVSVLWVATR